jgi:cellulose synthase/poly-beta-1,6-N-acetylglucosamine synthase-like glycosyltransferase
MITFFVHSIFLIFYVYIAVSICYLLVIAVAGKFKKGNEYAINPVKKRIAVVIPSYKEDKIIFHTAQQALAHDYDRNQFEVMVVADQLQPHTVEKLKTIVKVLEVKFEKSMKSKSIHAALELLRKENFEIVVILDADNIMGFWMQTTLWERNAWKKLTPHFTEAAWLFNAIAPLKIKRRR